MTTKTSPTPESCSVPQQTLEDRKAATQLVCKVAPIYRVHDDVLREIISWAVIIYDQPWPDATPFPSLETSITDRAHTMVRLIKVCRRFKDIIYGHATLWAGIAGVPSSEEDFNFVLEKAGQVPLAIVVHGREGRTLKLKPAQSAFATNHLDRVSILCANQSADYNWFHKLSGRSAPALTALKVHFPPFVGVGDGETSPLDAPSLRFLSLHRLLIPFKAPQLQELSLSRCGRMSPATLLDVLSSTSLLERLSLTTLPCEDGVEESENWTDCTGREVHLPHLERLFLHQVSCDTVAEFLGHLVLHAETGVYIQVTKHNNPIQNMGVMGPVLHPFLSCPVYDSIRIRHGNFLELFARDSRDDSPRVSLRVFSRDENTFEYVEELSPFLLPRHITLLDVGLTCEGRSYNKEVVEKSLRRIAPSVQTLSIEVKERLELSFLTDELSWLKFPALRTLKINWLDTVPNSKRNQYEWDGLRAWMKRVGAKQLETLHLDGWGNSIDNWCVWRVKEILAEQKSKCEIVDERREFRMLVNCEPLFGPPQARVW
ncbi:hypothetical protein PENSPDRAFT_752681 [Peniophora sp. CONT]|nr:hypothetical protein PENSPDRAFT_752681 [Peniophora sp. CONT]